MSGLGALAGGVEQFLDQHAWILWSLVGLSALTLILSVILIPYFIGRLPADYYRREQAAAPALVGWAPRGVRLALRAGRNVLGVVLLLAGIAMLVLPGQGLLTVLAGLALVEFPGKRRLEIGILRSRGVARLVGWLRRRAGRPPLEL